jgi:hypothetical protein
MFPLSFENLAEFATLACTPRLSGVPERGAPGSPELTLQVALWLPAAGRMDRVWQAGRQPMMTPPPRLELVLLLHGHHFQVGTTSMYTALQRTSLGQLSAHVMK